MPLVGPGHRSQRNNNLHNIKQLSTIVTFCIQATYASSSSNLCNTNHLQSAYPAPEPDFIEQLSKGNIPGYTSSPNAKISTGLKKQTLSALDTRFRTRS